MHFLTYALLMVVRFFLSLLPQKAVFFCGRLLGRIAWFVCKKQRIIVDDNLRLSSIGCDLNSTEREHIARQVFDNIGISVFEFLQTEKYFQSWASKVQIDPHLIRVISEVQKSQGVILALSHFNNWELSTLLKNHVQGPVLTVGQKIKNPYLDRWIKKQRTAEGVLLAEKQGFMRQALKVLKQRGVVALLSDQNAGSHGQSMSFLGRKASTFVSPAILGLKTGAWIVPIYNLRDNQTGEHLFVADSPINPQAVQDQELALQAEQLTRLQLNSLEEKIKQHPHAWFWVHRRWKK